ncbi:MAG: phage holin family protein [Verrucomicrobiota bacterium]|nr:phage holin family protein [Verrucomicrobiota bacterium]
MATATTEAGSHGFMDGIKGTLATWVAILKTRVELISTELEEQREWLEKLVILMVVSLFSICFGLVLFTLFIVFLVSDAYRVHVLGGFALLYLGVGAWAVISMKNSVKNKPKLFSVTAEELEKDHLSLTTPRL